MPWRADLDDSSVTEEEGEDAEQQEDEGHSPDWIDPCLLEDKVDESICALVKPECW